MQTIFPKPLEEIMAELLRTGRWEGELVHTKKDGTRAIVASRWSVQRDTRGYPVAILETNNETSLSASRPKMPCGEAMPIWRKRRN